MKHIVSRDNPSFRALKKLCLSSRERQKNTKAVLDGIHLIESYVKHLGEPEELVVSESGLQQPEIAAFIKQQQGCDFKTYLLANTLFSELAVVDTPSGLLAVIRYPECTQTADLQLDAVLLDGIQDPGNLGSILRSAAASGLRQIFLSEDCAQVWSPKTLRAGMGAHFSMCLYEKTDLSVFLQHYHGNIVLTTLEATHSLYELDLKKPVAWIFGNEGQGIRSALLSAMPQSAQQVKIPMPGMSESLNVAAAAAVCFFEAVRQRQSQA